MGNIEEGFFLVEFRGSVEFRFGAMCQSCPQVGHLVQFLDRNYRVIEVIHKLIEDDAFQIGYRIEIVAEIEPI